MAERRPVPRLLWKKETGQTDLLGSRGPGDLSGPADLAFLPNGQVVVADRSVFLTRYILIFLFQHNYKSTVFISILSSNLAHIGPRGGAYLDSMIG